MTGKRESLAEKLASRRRFHELSGCWIWTGAVNGQYGTVWHDGKNLYAHRVSYELFCGEIPVGLVVCHRCDTPLCVNPSHLFVGTYLDNQHDCMAKGRWTRGSRHGMARLDEGAVKAIRQRKKSGEKTDALAAEFGVHPATVRKAVAKKSWAHVQ